MSVLCRGAVPVLDVITPVTKTPFFRVPSFNYPFPFFANANNAVRGSKALKGDKYIVSRHCEFKFL